MSRCFKTFRIHLTGSNFRNLSSIPFKELSAEMSRICRLPIHEGNLQIQSMNSLNSLNSIHEFIEGNWKTGISHPNFNV